MIAFNSLAAFSQSLARGEPAASVPAVSPGRGAGVEQATPVQRRMAESRGVEAGSGAASPQGGTPPRGRADKVSGWLGTWRGKPRP